MQQNQSLKDQLTTTPEIRSVAKLIVSSSFWPSVSFRTHLSSQSPILSLIALSLPWWELWLEVLGALVPQVGVGAAKQHVTPLFLLMDRVLWDHSSRDALCPALLSAKP